MWQKSIILSGTLVVCGLLLASDFVAAESFVAAGSILSDATQLFHETSGGVRAAFGAVAILSLLLTVSLILPIWAGPTSFFGGTIARSFLLGGALSFLLGAFSQDYFVKIKRMQLVAQSATEHLSKSAEFGTRLSSDELSMLARALRVLRFSQDSLMGAGELDLLRWPKAIRSRLISSFAKLRGATDPLESLDETLLDFQKNLNQAVLEQAPPSNDLSLELTALEQEMIARFNRADYTPETFPVMADTYETIATTREAARSTDPQAEVSSPGSRSSTDWSAIAISESNLSVPATDRVDSAKPPAFLVRSHEQEARIFARVSQRGGGLRNVFYIPQSEFSDMKVIEQDPRRATELLSAGHWLRVPALSEAIFTNVRNSTDLGKFVEKIPDTQKVEVWSHPWSRPKLVDSRPAKEIKEAPKPEELWAEWGVGTCRVELDPVDLD